MMCSDNTEPIKHLCNLNGHFNIVSLQKTLIFLILTKKKDCVLLQYKYFLELNVCYTVQPFEMVECNICLSAKDKPALEFLSVSMLVVCSFK